MKTVIMAGGKGTRIRSVRSDVPKPMIEICGKPILQYQIENLREYNLTDITIGVGYLGDAIKDFFKDDTNLSYTFSEINFANSDKISSEQIVYITPTNSNDTIKNTIKFNQILIENIYNFGIYFNYSYIKIVITSP